jgi:hypothetical protein
VVVYRIIYTGKNLKNGFERSYSELHTYNDFYFDIKKLGNSDGINWHVKVFNKSNINTQNTSKHYDTPNNYYINGYLDGLRNARNTQDGLRNTQDGLRNTRNYESEDDNQSIISDITNDITGFDDISIPSLRTNYVNHDVIMHDNELNLTGEQLSKLDLKLRTCGVFEDRRRCISDLKIYENYYFDYKWIKGPNGTIWNIRITRK